MEDLLKVSNHANGATGNRASAINTTSNASLNFRSISAARWNKALLLAKQSPTTTDRTPVTAFPTPDWIYVARDGSNPGNGGTAVSINNSSPYISLPSVDPSAAINNTQAGHNPITQRYAYAVYDEGSTLDMNVAGSPITGTNGSTITYTPQQPYKNALAYADLTQLLTGFGLSASQEEAFVNGIVGWRNNGSGQASGSFPSYTFGIAVPPAAHPFDAFILSTRGGFLSSGGSATQSDNAFTSRQQLLQYLTTPTFLNAAGLSDAQMQTLCPYLGTFSRDISQPSYAPPAGRPKVLAAANGGNNAAAAAHPGFPTIDDEINPSFLGVTVPSAFTRNDGSTAVTGEPLVKKRFALNRIAWVTYNGPSANRNLGDADMVALINDGIPATFLQEGTPANIQKYFGLDWDSSNHQWKYDINNGGSGPIQKIAAMTTPHDPDFFELLKASIGVGSIAKALSYSNSAVPADPGTFQTEQPANYNYYAEYSVDFQILQIGANIIDQFQPANYAVQIVFNDGGGSVYSKRTIVGVENLPYLNALLNGVMQVQQPTPLPRNGKSAYGGSVGSGTSGDSGYKASDSIQASGVGAWMQLPVIWNPHDPSSPVGAVGPSSFRVLADSATPDVVANGGSTYNKFLAYGYSSFVGNSYNAVSAPAGWNGAVGVSYAVSFQNPPSGTAKAAEIDFSSNLSSKELCPEPFILMRSTGGIDSNLNTITIQSLPSTDLIVSDANLKATGQSSTSGLKSYVGNQPNMQSSEVKDPVGTAYVGFCLGAFPLAWNAGSQPGSAAQSGAYLARVSGTSPVNSACYMTYRMQYKDANNNWVTYDTKYGKAYDGNSCSLNGVSPISNPPASGALLSSGNGQGTDWGFVTDPRTPRFGIMGEANFASPVSFGNIGSPLPGPEPSWGFSGSGAYGAGWLNSANGTLYTTRPDGQAGFFCITGWPFRPGEASQIGPTSGWMAYIGSNGSDTPGLAPGLLSQNNADILYYPHEFYGDSQGSNTSTPNYFADPDGMVRRAMGGYVPLGSSTSSPQAHYAQGSDCPPADTTVGLPMARAFGWTGSLIPSSPNVSIANYSPTAASPQVTSQAQSRPYFLHRPFNSVAELGYVFSDTPWRNLDFFTAESGNAALLDTFCINDTTDPGALVAGKVNLNTRQAAVIQAVIAGGYLDPALQAAQPTATAATERIDSATAKLVAQALVARTTDTANSGTNGTGPLGNLSELVGKWEKSIAIHNLGSKISGANEGTLSSKYPNTFYDGKLSYAGFSGGVWDTANQKPYVNGVEDFTSSSGSAKAASAAEDVYSAYYNSPSFATSTYHSGSQETATYIQRFREAPIRALSAAGTTRVWNLMIDVIAQAGRFPSTATSLSNFNVEGERRYWVHVALDRLTGKVLDEQVEEVKE